MNHLYIGGSALFLLLVLCACAESDESSFSHSFRIYEENGITFAKTTGGPRFDDQLFSYVKICRLEQDESRPETLLSTVRQAALDEMGAVYICDRRNYRIAVFNPDGTYRHSFGREGSGPGEFRILSLLWVQNGQVCVIDRELRRASLFKTDGSFLRSVPYPRNSAFRGAFFQIDGIHPVTDTLTVLHQTGFTPADFQLTSRTAIFTTEDSLIAEIISPASPYPMTFQGTPYTYYIPSVGIIRTTMWRPILEVFDLTGNVRRKIIVETVRIPVTVDDRASIRQFYENAIESEPDTLRIRALQEEYKELVFPEYRDFWDEPSVDGYGYLWIRVPDGRPGNPASEAWYRVLSPEGEYMGNTQLPLVTSYWSKAEIGEDRLIIMYEDTAMGAPVVELYRIQPVARGFKYPY